MEVLRIFLNSPSLREGAGFVFARRARTISTPAPLRSTMPGPQPQLISDPADPRIADYSNLMDRQLIASDLFMAEGELVVRQLLNSHLKTKSILITPNRLDSLQFDRLPPETPIYLASQPLMNQIVGFNIHRGILAVGFRPTPPSLPDVLAKAKTLVVLEDLSNHDNLGGIFRSAAALGGLAQTAILLSPRCCDPLYRKAIRVSMGTALRLPFATLDPWPSSLSLLKQAGFTLIALSPTGCTPIQTLKPPAKVALLLGAEGPGLTPDSLAMADISAQIPMDPAVDSLNVVSAAGIALHRLAHSF